MPPTRPPGPEMPVPPAFLQEALRKVRILFTSGVSAEVASAPALLPVSQYLGIMWGSRGSWARPAAPQAGGRRGGEPAGAQEAPMGRASPRTSRVKPPKGVS